MKTTKEGSLQPKPVTPLWVGLEVNCSRCGWTAILEEGDEVATTQEKCPNGKITVTGECPTKGCGGHFRLDFRPSDRHAHLPKS